METAATAELRSEQPLGKAIVAFARRQGHNIIEPATFSYTPGRGISTDTGDATILVGNQGWMADNEIDISAASPQTNEAGTEIFVARGGRLLGSLIVADTTEAKRAVDALHRTGIRTVLLTGDAKRVATAVCSNLGIKEIEAELLPENKLTRIQALVQKQRVVAMVGDADIGFGKCRCIVDAVARRTRDIIWQNFAGTIGVDTLGILLAALGFLNPLLAAGIHVVSELVFILNSARLLPSPEKTIEATPDVPALMKA